MLETDYFNCHNLVNNFDIDKKIGSGGMGNVYLATDKRLDRKVAIKLLKLPCKGKEENDEFITRFKREAKAIAKLHHQNIVSIFDIGDENNQYYMIMEYIEGKNLEQLLKLGMILDTKSAALIAFQICNALEYAHHSEIIHRDIKPANIILTGTNSVKLTDFGIARINDALDENNKFITGSNLLGSIAYTSPEQLANASSVDNRADIYSLGITIYEALTGKLPFEAESIALFITKVMTEKPKSLHEINANIPKDFSDVINKMIEKDLNKRFLNVTEVKNELSKFIEKDTLLEISSFVETVSTKQEKELKDTTIINRKFLTSTLNSSLIITNEKFISYLKASNYIWVSLITSSLKTIDTKLTYQELRKKLTEPDIDGSFFSGFVIINEDCFLFLYEGYIIGALNSKKSLVGEKALESLPVFDTKIKLRPTSDKDKQLPIFISNILNLSGEKLHENLDSSLINIIPLIDELTKGKEKLTGYIICRKASGIDNKNEFSEMSCIFGFLKGEQIFSFSVGDTIVPSIVTESIENILSNDCFLVSIHKLKFDLPENNFKSILESSKAEVSYIDPNEVNLESLGTFKEKDIPNFIVSAFNENFYLNYKSSIKTKIKFVDEEVDLIPKIHNTDLHCFSKWLCSSLYFKLNNSNNHNILKSTYSMIPNIKYFSFYQNVKDSNNKNVNFSIIAYDKNDNPIVLVRFGDDFNIEFEKFLTDCNSFKTRLYRDNNKDTITTILYVSKNVSKSLFESCMKNTTKKSLFSKERNMFKTTYGNSLQVILVKDSLANFNVDRFTIACPDFINN